MDLLGKIRTFFSKYKAPRYRDRRAFYASNLLADARDIYWEATGEPVTDPSDFKSSMRMMMGKAIERELVHSVLHNLHWFGVHVLGASGDQIPIGISDPVNVDGYLDGLLVEREGENFGKPYVLEIKTAYGYGGDLLARNMQPKEEHLAQIGLYLHDLACKGVTDRGILLYIITSDANFGEVVQIDVRYEAGQAIAYQSQSMFGKGRTLIDGHTANIPKMLERLENLEKLIANKELPPATYTYKFPLTRELIDRTSDADLEKAINGFKVLGDWQPKYSRYKTLHIKAEGATPEYTAEEIAMLRQEYLARHPRTKKFR